jgi:hypothetical protein
MPPIVPQNLRFVQEKQGKSECGAASRRRSNSQLFWAGGRIVRNAAINSWRRAWSQGRLRKNARADRDEAA